MRKEDHDADDWGRTLTSWVVFGGEQARLHETGIVLTDLRIENLGLSSTGRVQIFDYHDFDQIRYPEEWVLLPIALMTLLVDLPPALQACVRFGYLQYGGPIAAAVIGAVRFEYGVNAFHDIPTLRYEVSRSTPHGSDSASLAALSLHAAWQKSRAKYLKGEPNRAWPDMATFLEWVERRSKYSGLDLVLGDHFYVRHLLAVATKERSLPLAVAGLLNLSHVEVRRGRVFRAAGLAHLAKRLVETCENRHGLPADLTKWVEECSASLAVQTSPDDRQLLETLPFRDNVFHWCWQLDDCEAGSIIGLPRSAKKKGKEKGVGKKKGSHVE